MESRSNVLIIYQFNMLVPVCEIMEFSVCNSFVVDKFLYKLCLVWVNEKIDKEKETVWFIEKCALRIGQRKKNPNSTTNVMTSPVQ